MKISLPRLLLVLCAPVMLFVAACNKGSNNSPLVPVVTTNPILSSLKDTTVTVSYMITNYAVGTVTSYGICWSSTNHTPSVSDSKTSTSSASAVNFVGTANGLKAGTTYYIRGYAVTSTSTLYGNVIQFTTATASTAVYGTVSTFAGSGTAGLGNGTGTGATFNNPQGIAFDKSGNMYIADAYNNTIRMVTSTGVVTRVAGSGTAGYTDANGANAQFYSPTGLTVDGNGNIYVADAGNSAIRKIDVNGNVTTLAGGKFVGLADNTGTVARFNTPTGITIDGSGNLYVADRGNHAIRLVTSAGVVTTLAGTNSPGYIDSTGTYARFNAPTGIALDGSGNLLVADAGNSSLRKVTTAGVVTTIIGNPTAYTTALNTPIAVASDLKGRTFITDATGQILEIASNSVLYSIAGAANTYGFANGSGSAIKFNSPQGLALDASGNVYVTDSNNNMIRKLVLTFNP